MYSIFSDAYEGAVVSSPRAAGHMGYAGTDWPFCETAVSIEMT